MTTQNSLKLKIEYVRGTERADPVVRLGLHVPLFFRIKILFWLLLGKIVWYALNSEEIEDLSHKIIRWRLVNKLRTAKKRTDI